MPVRGTSYGRATLFLALAGILLVTSLSGCKYFSRKRNIQKGGESASGTAKADPKSAGGPVEPRFRQSFVDATRKDPLDGWNPPTVTATGKPVGPLYEQVKKSWDGIHFVSDEGKRVVYHAVLDTEDGTVEIELRPDWAPNHVRNFVALAQSGYYDGLVFNRIVNQMSRKSGEKVEMVEGGGPLGAADDQDGIGYWLNSEFDAKLAHEEGVVGASHGEEENSAACKFYVMLSKTPRLDGNYTVFGKVVKGLDVAHTIAKKDVAKDETNGTGEESEDVDGGDYHLAKPTVIRKVKIETHEVDKAGPGGDN